MMPILLLPQKMCVLMDAERGDKHAWFTTHTCLTGYIEPIVFSELNLGQLVISIGSSRNWRPLKLLYS